MRSDPADGDVVLLTGGEYLSVLAAVRSLRAAGYVPWVTAHVRGTYAARSRATAGTVIVPRPGLDPEGFATAVSRLARDLGAVAILPGTDVAMSILAARTSALPEGVALGSACPEILAVVCDKRHLPELVAGTGLSVPPTVEVLAGRMPSMLPFPFPVVVKPPRPEIAGSRGTTRHYGARAVATIDELHAAVTWIPDGVAIVQPMLSGPLGSIAGVFWHGRLIAAVQAEGDRVWPWPCGSISHARTVPLDPSLVAAITAMLGPTGWQGLFQLDFFRVGDEIVVIDFNPRLYTSLGHATRVGVNLAAIWVDALRGREPAVPASYPAGVGYRNEEGDLRALLRALVHGPRMAALRGVVPDRRTALAVTAFDDPGPMLTSIDHATGYLRRRSRRSAAASATSAE